MININRKELNDDNYRYKMRDIIISEGNQTTIKNIDEISDDLGRPQEILMNVLAGNGSGKPKNNVINCRVNKETLYDRLYNFIDKFVLCQNCEKPELELYLDKNNLSSKCDACSGINILTFNNKFYKSINKDLKKYIKKNGNIKKKVNVVLKNDNQELSFDDLFN